MMNMINFIVWAKVHSAVDTAEQSTGISNGSREIGCNIKLVVTWARWRGGI